jgi:hypothetical protein
MIVLRLEHKAPSYEEWKKTFDSDPINRKQSGVKHYRIYRAIDNPNHVVMEFEFNTLSEAQNLLAALDNFWEKTAGSIIINPKIQLLDIVESIDLL